MKKVISVLLLCTPFSALAGDADVKLTFSGTLTSPTCTASFVGTKGTDIGFGNINASDIIGKKEDTVIAAAPVRDVSLQFTGCGGGVSRVLVSFQGTDVSGYGFFGKAPSLVDSGGVKSGLGFALFTDKSKSAVADALGFRSEVTTVDLNSGAVTKSSDKYTWPIYAKMVVTREASLATEGGVNSNSAGKDLTAKAYVNISYE